MSWIALLLVGLGVTDLVRSCRPLGGLEGCVGGSVALLLGLLAGLTSVTDVVGLVVVAAAGVAWGLLVQRHLDGGSAAPALGLGLGAGLRVRSVRVVAPVAAWSATRTAPRGRRRTS